MLMPLRHGKASGFSIIELMVAVSILGIVMAIGIPSLSDWIRRGSVTSMAESIQNGLRLSFGEAVKQNAPVQFILTDSDVSSATVTSAVAKDNGNNWMSRVLDRSTFPTAISVLPSGYLAGGSSRELSGSSGSSGLSVEGPASVIFNGAGRIVDTDGALLSTYQVYRISRTDVDKALCVFVTPGAGVKMCDPSYPSGDARSCAPMLTLTQCRKAGT